jgi:hypothetical protein
VSNTCQKTGHRAQPDPRDVAQQIRSSIHGGVALELNGLVLTPNPEATVGV